MADACNASHTAFGSGVRCELDDGHHGLHRAGALAGRVVYWSCEADLATRHEVFAELALLLHLLDASERSTLGAFGTVPPDEVDDAVRGASIYDRVADDALAAMRRRAAALVETLHGPGALVDDARLRANILARGAAAERRAAAIGRLVARRATQAATSRRRATKARPRRKTT